jgi:hypothetical protein
MMKAFVKIILFFLFASSAHAYCDFETMRIGQSIKAIPDKLKSGFLLGETIDQPFELHNRSEEICSDEEFDGIRLRHEFIAGELQRIRADDEIGAADHLSNLKYYYGEPTELSEDDTSTGIRYYYWKLDFKEIFLITRFTENTSSHQIEFLSNQYDQIKNAGKDFLDE